jgi:hypothetical protein
VKSRKSFLIALLFLTTVLGAAWSWKQYQDILVLRAAHADDTDLARRLADAQKQLKNLRDQIAALRQPAPAEDAAANAEPSRRSPGGNFAGFRAMMNNPQFQKLMAVQQKAMLDNTYAPLFKMLNLTPQQLEQFKNLMVQKQQALMDAVQAARDQGITPRSDPQAFQDAITQAQAAVDSQIQAALGDAGFAAYQQYQQTLPQRATVTSLQQSLSYTPTPLTDDQASQLIGILAQTSPPANNNGGNGLAAAFGRGAAGPGGGAQVSDQAITLAQGFLSAPQVQALQQLQQQQQVQKQMQQLMRASRQAANGGG